MRVPARCKPRGAGLRGDGKAIVEFPTWELGEHVRLSLAVLAGVWLLEGEGMVFPVREHNIAGVNKGDGKVTVTLKH